MDRAFRLGTITYICDVICAYDYVICVSVVTICEDIHHIRGVANYILRIIYVYIFLL